MKLLSIALIGSAIAQDYVYDYADDVATTVSPQERGKNKNKNNNYNPPPPAEPTYEPTPDPYQPPAPTSDDQCWHCDEPTMEACQEKGMMKSCRFHPEGDRKGNVCMIELRKRDGDIFGVCMGCKDESTCMNQKANNFEYGKKWKLNQCKPTAKEGVSVCRNCCKGKNCWGTRVKDFVLGPESSKAEWAADYLGYGGNNAVNAGYNGGNNGGY